MKRPLLGEKKDEVHRVKITLSAKNAKDLEKMCANIVSSAKNKRLVVKDDDDTPLKALPIKAKDSPFGNGMDYSIQHSGRASKKGCTNFRWSPAMTKFLLPFLVEQAKLGLKVNKTFKRPALVAAARAVSEKFHLVCTDSNVDNHLRTVKTHFAQIKRLQNLSSTFWDENEKKIVMDITAYREHIMANPKDEPFLNKKIDTYDEMAFIYGDEQYYQDTTVMDAENDQENLLPTTAEDLNVIMSDDIDIEEEEDAEETESKARQNSTSAESTGKTRQRDNTNHYLGDKIEQLASQIGQLAEAIKSIQRGISSELFAEVMKCEGYDEISLGKAFDYLHQRENLGRAFLAKNYNLRQAWLADFFSSGLMD